jgi:phospholipid/cholesterol/gamma-HCH transport system ATP-binding protein
MAYGDFLIQKDLNFTINRSDIFIIMGGSGCGKSTLLKVMIGLKSPATGDIFYDGKPFWQSPEPEQELLKRNFGTLFQSGALWSSMTLAENIGLALKQYTNLSDAEIREVAAYKLMLVGLAGFEDYYPNEISGGMKKRAGLARAMALDPEILFCRRCCDGVLLVLVHFHEVHETGDREDLTVVITQPESGQLTAVSPGFGQQADDQRDARGVDVAGP